MRFAHVGMTVSDMDRSVSFFREVFELEPFHEVEREGKWLSAIVGYEGTRIRFVHMRSPCGLHLELLRYIHPHAEYACYEDTYLPGNVHVSFETDDASAVLARFMAWLSNNHLHGRAHRASVYENIQDTAIPDGPNAGQIGFYIRDPDGHTIEVTQKAAK